MLLELAELLKGYGRLFALFDYLTVRAILSALTALAVSLLAGPCWECTAPTPRTWPWPSAIC